MKHAALARQQGFNLVEIMVSMVLAVMVFLGLAKGQVVSLQQARLARMISAWLLLPVGAIWMGSNGLITTPPAGAAEPL